MNKILNYILKGRGRGLLPLLTGSILLAMIISLFFHTNIDKFAPLTAEDIKPILPITFKDGAIVDPADQLRKTTVKRDNIEYTLVLDTRDDEISTDELDKTGLYLSRRYFYVVDGQNIRRQPIEDMNVTVDESNIKQGFEQLRFYIVTGVFIFASLGLFVFFLLAAFALLLPLLFARSAKGLSFSARMRLNSLVVLWTTLAAFGLLFTPWAVPTVVYFVLAILIQYTFILKIDRKNNQTIENKD